MQNVLVVCVGNICRSPVAEAMLKARLPDISVASAGLAAAVGRPADPVAQEIATAHGLDLSAHRAQQISRWMCANAELILVMERRHQDELEQRYPTARGKIRCLGDQGAGQTLEVSDPYKRPRWAFEAAHDAIASGVETWARRIEQLR